MTTPPKTQKSSSWFLFGRTAGDRNTTRWQSVVLQWTVSILMFLLFWQLISMAQIVPAKALPSPAAVLAEIQRQPEFFTLAYIPRRGNFFNLPTSILISLQRVMLGLASAFVASLIIGSLISYVPLIRRLLLPIIQLMAPISPIAWMPVIAVFFGVSETAIVAVIFIALFFVLTLSTIESIENVPKVYVDTSRVLGATSRLHIMAYVVLPAIVPDLFLALRLNFFAAWLSLLVAEFIGAKTGLGQMVIAGRGVFNMSLVILAMIVIGVCGMLCEAGLRAIQNHVLWWRRQVEI